MRGGDEMNIFYLHEDPEIAAKAMTNKHVIKMTLESAQMLSTAHQVLDGYHEQLYKKSYMNHPSSVWVRASTKHYDWLLQHFIALSKEYTRRYKKEHKSYTTLYDILKLPPNNLKDKGFREPPQCMPKKYHKLHSRDAYRSYYVNEKIKDYKELERFMDTLNILGENNASEWV